MLDALIGVYERNVLGYPSTAVLPYSQALNRFPAHLQQVDMESNGKSVNRFGEPVNYPTGPVLFGEPGTNGQHSFYQLLHQGTDIVPLQFVGFRNNQMETDVDIQGSTSQQKLCANVAAQIVAFACGKADENKNKNFELSVLCVITGLWHQQTVGWGESKVLLIISFVFAFTHLAFYLYRLGKQFTSLPVSDSARLCLDGSRD